MPVFKTGAFNRSATPPSGDQPMLAGSLDWRLLLGQVAEWLKALAC